MSIYVVLEVFFKWLFLFSAIALGVTYYNKSTLPDPAYYATAQLEAPRQTPTEQEPFNIKANDQEYTITPRYAYELDGVVVSSHNADDFIDITHHERWKDFINLRDLCVIWGSNVASGVYQRMEFHNDSWTCWFAWTDAATGALFQKNALSNNHLLTNDEAIAQALLSAEPGDHIRLRGVLAEYSNASNGFHRGTSITREDTGNGACETIFVDEFNIVNKANVKLRRFYNLAKWMTIFSGIGFAVMFVIAPVRAGR